MTSIKQTGTLLTADTADSPNRTERLETLLVASPAATAVGGLRLVSRARISEIERVYILLSKNARWVRQAHDAVISAGAMPEWVSSPSAMMTSARSRKRSYGVLITSDAVPARAVLTAGFRCLPFNPDTSSPNAWSRALGQELCRAELEGIWAFYQSKTPTGEENSVPENLRIEPDTAPLPDAATIDVIWSAFKDVESGGSNERIRVAIVEGPSGSGKESVSRLLCLAWHRRTRRSSPAATDVGRESPHLSSVAPTAPLAQTIPATHATSNPEKKNTKSRNKKRGGGATVSAEATVNTNSMPGEHRHESMSLAALTETLARSELIGIGRGVGTLVDARAGIFERVGRGGSVHLDEVAKATESVQSAMLRVLSEGVVRREGEHRWIPLAPMFVALSTATGPNHKEKILPDLRSRGRENVIELPSLAKFEPDALAGVVRWLTARHGVPFVSGAALRVFDRYRSTEMRELGFAVRIAAERARARLGDVACKRYCIMACDVPIPHEAPVEKKQDLQTLDQSTFERNQLLMYVREAISKAANRYNEDPKHHIQRLMKFCREQGTSDGSIKALREQTTNDEFAKGVVRELWDFGEKKATNEDFENLLGLTIREWKSMKVDLGLTTRR